MMTTSRPPAKKINVLLPRMLRERLQEYQNRVSAEKGGREVTIAEALEILLDREESGR